MNFSNRHLYDKYKENAPHGAFFLALYSIAHASVNSYVPDSSVYDTPAGAYIMQFPAGFDTKHDSAVPTAVVPLGQLVAMVICGSSIAI